MTPYITLILLPTIALSAFAQSSGWTSDNASGTLPVLYISTQDSMEIGDDKKIYTKGSLAVGEKSQIFTVEEMESIEIRRRGNHSWADFEKKPYKIKFSKEHAFLGLKPNKHFALMAGADGMLHDILGFAASRAVGLPWAPEVVPVELVLNGEYKGLYMLTETIRIGPNRINIKSQNDYETDPEKITGGWLCEIDNYKEENQISLFLDNIKVGRFTYHSPEKISQIQYDYLYNQIYTISKSLRDGTAEWHECIDIEAMARFYVMHEICENTESFAGSCFFYKDRGADAKWVFGPAWDFGNAAISYRSPSKSFFWEESQFFLVWIKWMVKDSVFMDVVRQTWAEFYANYNGEIEDEISRYIEMMRLANEIDKARWPKYHPSSESYDSGEAVCRNVRTRIEWLNSVWTQSGIYKPEADAYPSQYYNLQGQQVTNPSHGLYIKNGKIIFL